MSWPVFCLWPRNLTEEFWAVSQEHNPCQDNCQRTGKKLTWNVPDSELKSPSLGSTSRLPSPSPATYKIRTFSRLARGQQETLLGSAVSFSLKTYRPGINSVCVTECVYVAQVGVCVCTHTFDKKKSERSQQEKRQTQWNTEVQFSVFTSWCLQLSHTEFLFYSRMFVLAQMSDPGLRKCWLSCPCSSYENVAKNRYLPRHSIACQCTLSCGSNGVQRGWWDRKMAV